MKFKAKKYKISILLMAIASLLLIAHGCDGGNSGCNPAPAICDYDTCSEGPYATRQDLNAGPSGNSGLFYPTNGDGPFPILVFGCGAGTNPPAYVDHGNYIASWGFIVVIETSSNSGRELTRAIDWLQTQNNSSRSVLYQKCNLSKIAAGGHSRGSLGTFAIADDPRLTTTIHVAGGAGNGAMGSTAGADNLRNPAAFICGEADNMATSNAEIDYRNANVPVFMTVMAGVDHISAARQGLPAICAWMLWQLSDETGRRGDFLDPNGEFRTGSKWNSKSKNFN